MHLGDTWSSLRGILRENFSFTQIKDLVGAAGLPVHMLAHLQQKYTGGTSKGQLMDAVDGLVLQLSVDDRDRFVAGCIKEVLMRKPDSRPAVEEVLRRVNWGITGTEPRPVSFEELQGSFPSGAHAKSIQKHEGQPADPEFMEWDAFISHAYEDKQDFVRPLAEALNSRGLKVWYDEFTLKVGDSLRRSIDRGLAKSRYGIVVLSPNFLAKEWPQKELDGLVARETDGRKVILPVWHNLSAQEVRRHSPTLADRLATSSSRGIDRVVSDLLSAMSASAETTGTA